MTTIKDVAKYAGVSTATVSRYLNRSGYISVDSVAKIKQAIQHLEYTPSAVARSLSTQTSSLVGLIIPDLGNPYFPQLVKGIEDTLKLSGYNVLLGSVASEIQFFEFLETFKRNNVAGIISSVGISPEVDPQIPIVEVDRVSLKNKYSVTTNDYQGGKLIAEALNKTKNMNHIAIIVGPKSSEKSKKRIAGLYDFLCADNCKITEIEAGSFGIEDTPRVLEKLFAQEDFPDTIIAPNDLYGIVILQELLKRKILVPEEVQIIGYDGIDFIRLIYPEITTIKQPIYRLGNETANLLIKIIKKDNITDRHIELDVSFSVGETLRF